MEQITVIVGVGESEIAPENGIILSVKGSMIGAAEAVVGRPGMPNLDASFTLGSAVLFETPEGLYEVRLMSASPTRANFLITQITPKPGLAAGFVEQDVENSRFTSDERVQITRSVKTIRLAMAQRTDLASEQLDYITRKLNEIDEASGRYGRKEWMNLVLGTLTSTAVQAGLESQTAKALFQAAGQALSWLYQGGLTLIQ